MQPGRIKLLPDHVANQIAAGEVVQRPASVVKELMENALDAGADEIKLIVKDGGKALIQVVDNGQGMNEVDARMAFERHATSKISSAEDLFQLQTKGFRGEALASIAAVAHVEMKTKTADAELGTYLKIEGSQVVKQEPVATPKGTSIAVKNLFYNIPARRKFLKSAQVEMRHINDEFFRLALAHPVIAFSLIHNGNTVYHLPKSNRLQRIGNLFGNKMPQKLVPVEEATDYIKIYGFTGKPEFAKLKRGEQFFFVNNRFIKSPYLNHAVLSAYEGLIKEKAFPSYFIYFDIDPKHIDVNIHPTKTEIKFDDEQTVYAILKVAIKHSLGQFNLLPSMDFDSRPDLEVPYDYNKKAPVNPQINVDPGFNPFKEDDFGQPAKVSPQKMSKKLAYFESLMHDTAQTADQLTNDTPLQPETFVQFESDLNRNSFQLKLKYIVTNKDNQLLIVHQNRAHLTVLYHSILHQLQQGRMASQQLIFPVELQLNPDEISYLQEHQNKITAMGFDLDFDPSGVLVKGVPLQLKTQAITSIFQEILEKLRYENPDKITGIEERLALIIAEQSAVKTGQKLSEAEQQNLLTDLFKLSNPRFTPTGKKILMNIEPKDIDKKFD